MIGREHQQDGFAIAPAGEFSRDRNGGTGIATDRLKDDIRACTGSLQLIGDGKAKLRVRHDDRWRKNTRIGNPREDLLKRRRVAAQRNELFRLALARERPQPRSTTPANDDRRYQAWGHEFSVATRGH